MALKFDVDLKEDILLPPMYKVIMHNDDITTMDFVVMVLIKFFNMDKSKAITIMLKIHTKGSAVCGVYTYDIALSKIAQVTSLAKENNFPLKLTIEKD